LRRLDLTGTPAADALLLARARTTGIDGGVDAATLPTLAVVKVNAESVATITGSASATVLVVPKPLGIGKADSSAVGIQGWQRDERDHQRGANRRNGNRKCDRDE
jgi:hypothetical protein